MTAPAAAAGTVRVGDHVTPTQVALAWLLQRSPVMLPIPGTSRVTHLEENVAAASVQLTAQELHQLG